MSHERHILEEVVANPSDDTPRLVYADLLEEQGDPRAEFIRAEIELANLPEDDERRPALQATRQRVFQRYWKGWAGPLRSYVKSMKFERGFANHVAMRTPDFLEHGYDLLKLAPIQSVRLVDAGPYLDELIAGDLLKSFHAIDLSHNKLDVQWLQHFLNYLPERTQSLNLAHNHLGTDGCRILADAASLENLRALDLRATGMTAEEVSLLQESPHLQGVRELKLGSCRNFDNYNNPPPGELPAAVAPWVTRVESLVLDSCGITLAGIREIDQRASSLKLRTLCLERNPLAIENWWAEDGDEVRHSMNDLADAAFFRNVNTLILDSCYFDDASFANAVAGNAMQNVRALSINHNSIFRTGIEALANSSIATRLVELWTAGARAGRWGEAQGNFEEAVDVLANSARFPKLRQLSLRRHLLGDAALGQLAGTLLPQLHWLDLSNNLLTDESADLLVRIGPWAELSRLDVRNNKFGNPAKQRLRETFGSRVRF